MSLGFQVICVRTLIIGTLISQISERTRVIMHDMLKRTKEGNCGLRKSEEMEPWEIAPLLICRREGNLVDVEHATDDEFDAWIRKHHVLVSNGRWGNKWSFDDRCGVINHMRKFGIALIFLAQNNSALDQK